MELRQLRTFCTVAELESFTRAAKSLGYAQPTITTQVQLLEAELGQRLLDRVGRRVRLTEPGGVLKRYADQMLALNDEALKALEGLSRPQGRLAIAATESICILRLPPVLSEYAVACAEVRVTVTTGTAAELLAGVLEHRLDLALIAGPVAGGELLVYEPLFEEPLVLAAGPCLAGIDASVAPLIAFTRGCAYRERLDALGAQLGRPLSYAMEFSSMAAVRANLLAGLGLALLPLAAVEGELQSGQLVQRRIAGGEAPSVPLGLVHHRTSYLTPALRRFIELTHARLRPSACEQASMARATASRPDELR